MVLTAILVLQEEKSLLILTVEKVLTVVVLSQEKILQKLTVLLLMLHVTLLKTWLLQAFATKCWYRLLMLLVLLNLLDCM